MPANMPGNMMSRLDEAMHRLRAQEESVAATDRLRETYKDRLAGISIEHSPEYRIVVLLTGDAPVADEQVIAGDRAVPIIFRTGAVATEAQISAAIAAHQAEIRAAFHHAGGIGVDTRTGALIVMVKAFEVFGRDLPAEEQRLAEIAGVPVRIMPIGGGDANSSIDGGSRIVGTNPDGHRYACTTGFVVNGAAAPASSPPRIVPTASLIMRPMARPRRWPSSANGARAIRTCRSI